MRKERDVRVYKKIMALMFVPEDDIGVPEAARGIRCSENSVRSRLARFSEDGIDGLRDLPRSGCRPGADRKKVCGHVPLLARHENHNHASNSCLTDGGR